MGEKLIILKGDASLTGFFARDTAAQDTGTGAKVKQASPSSGPKTKFLGIQRLLIGERKNTIFDRIEPLTIAVDFFSDPIFISN